MIPYPYAGRAYQQQLSSGPVYYSYPERAREIVYRDAERGPLEFAQWPLSYNPAPLWRIAQALERIAHALERR